MGSYERGNWVGMKGGKWVGRYERGKWVGMIGGSG